MTSNRNDSLSHFFKGNLATFLFQTGNGFFIEEAIVFGVLFDLGWILGKNNLDNLFSLLLEEEVVRTQRTLWLVLWLFLLCINNKPNDSVL